MPAPRISSAPLTRRGTIEAQEMAARLVYRNLVPDLILVSPAERAWSTAEISRAPANWTAKQVQCARELYLATPETTWRLLARRDAALRHILICGHNPGLSQLASRLGPKPQRRNLPTGGLVTAVWQNALWDTLQPETAISCELDDPEEHGGSCGSERQRSSLIALQPQQAAPVALVRPRLGPRARQLRQSLLFAQIRSPQRARRRLAIVRLRLGGGAAARGSPSTSNSATIPCRDRLRRSPMRTRCAGFTRSAFRWTLPPMIAAVARLRVL